MSKDLLEVHLPVSKQFTLMVVGIAVALLTAIVGLSTAKHDLGTYLLAIGLSVVVAIALAYVLVSFVPRGMPSLLSGAVIGAAFGMLASGSAGAIVFGVILGLIAVKLLYWVHSRDYRRGLPPYLTPGQVLWHYGFRFICGMIFVFLITPILVVLPLSFNAEDFFTFTDKMLQLDPAGYSLKHYQDFFSNNEWQRSFKNSLIIAPIATVISVSLGTLAAIGLSQSHVPGRRAIMAVLISPMIVPLIISATGMFFFYSSIGNWLEGTLGFDKTFVGYVKVILAHAVLGIPFVIITVTATLVGFDRSLTRAAANMGANPVTTFFRVQMPLILPGVISGGLFAFITSFDEVVVVLFVGSASQKTLPWQMFTGLREQISPTILAVATILVGISILLLMTLEFLRRRSERLRGMTPQ